MDWPKLRFYFLCFLGALFISIPIYWVWTSKTLEATDVNFTLINGVNIPSVKGQYNLTLELANPSNNSCEVWSLIYSVPFGFREFISYTSTVGNRTVFQPYETRECQVTVNVAKSRFSDAEGYLRFYCVELQK